MTRAITNTLSVSPLASAGLSAADIATYYNLRAPKVKQPAAAEWRGPCPIHDGEGDNFTIETSTGKWFCHSRCGRGGDVFQLEKELSGLPDFPAAKRAVLELIGRGPEMEEREKKWETVAEYIYRDETGGPLFRVQRKRRMGVTGWEKTFTQSRLLDGRWVPGIKGVRLVPYRLAELVAAEMMEPVFIAEGEKDADRLAGVGLTATCNPMGAGKARMYSDWLGYFRGRHLVILPDNDEPGRKHAADVAGVLLPVAATVRVLELPDLLDKGDVSDWLNAGGTVEKLRELAVVAEVIDADGLVVLRARWGLAVEEPGSEHGDRRKSPFRVKDDGVFWLKPDGEEGVEPVWLCDRLDILADTRDAAGDGWGRLLRWRDGDGREHLWAMPVRLLAGEASAVREHLVDGGLRITPNARLRERLADYLFTSAGRKIHCAGRGGWHGGSFLLPGWSATAPGAEELIYQSPTGAAGRSWRTAGTVEEWRTTIGAPCIDNSRLILAASIGFAGPLLELAGADGGGFHLMGGSSTGKTTALLVGASVIGGGPDGGGGAHSWRTTDNGLEAVATEHNDTSIFLDELGQLDPKKAADCGYMLANGRPKQRMNKMLAARDTAAWRLLFLSTGELSLSAHAATAGGRTRAGVEVRVVNVAADAGRGMGIFEELHGRANPGALADELKRAAGRCYGEPFREFLRRLVVNRNAARPVLDRCRALAKQWVPAGASGEVGRVADRFAIVAAAGELASSWGITGWTRGAALAAAERCFNDWLRDRGTAGGSDVEEGVKAVRRFIEMHGNSRFQRWAELGSGFDGELVLNRAGFKRNRHGRTEYLFLPETFKDDVLKGFDHRAVAQELRDRGHLIPEGGGRLTLKPGLPAGMRSRVYAILDSILDNDDAADADAA